MTPVGTWTEFLDGEGIPLCSNIDFQCCRGGVRHVLLEGKQIHISHQSRLFAREWLAFNRPEEFAPCTQGNTVNIHLDFSNGVPNYKPSLLDKRDQREERRITNIPLMVRFKKL